MRLPISWSLGLWSFAWTEKEAKRKMLI